MFPWRVKSGLSGAEWTPVAQGLHAIRKIPKKIYTHCLIAILSSAWITMPSWATTRSVQIKVVPESILSQAGFKHKAGSPLRKRSNGTLDVSLDQAREIITGLGIVEESRTENSVSIDLTGYLPEEFELNGKKVKAKNVIDIEFGRFAQIEYRDPRSNEISARNGFAGFRIIAEKGVVEALRAAQQAKKHCNSRGVAQTLVRKGSIQCIPVKDLLSKKRVLKNIKAGKWDLELGFLVDDGDSVYADVEIALDITPLAGTETHKMDEEERLSREKSRLLAQYKAMKENLLKRHCTANCGAEAEAQFEDAIKDLEALQKALGAGKSDILKEAGITARWLEQMEKKLAKIERDRKWAALNKKAKEADDITYSSVLDELIAWKHEHADDRKEASRAKNAAQSMLTRIAAKSHTMDSGLREQLTSDAVRAIEELELNPANVFKTIVDRGIVAQLKEAYLDQEATVAEKRIAIEEAQAALENFQSQFPEENTSLERQIRTEQARIDSLSKELDFQEKMEESASEAQQGSENFSSYVQHESRAVEDACGVSRFLGMRFSASINVLPSQRRKNYNRAIECTAAKRQFAMINQHWMLARRADMEMMGFMSGMGGTVGQGFGQQFNPMFGGMGGMMGGMMGQGLGTMMGGMMNPMMMNSMAMNPMMTGAGMMGGGMMPGTMGLMGSGMMNPSMNPMFFY